MKLLFKSYALAGILLTAVSLHAASVTLTLDQSAQNFVEYGLGSDIYGNPTWDLQQGACGFAGGITTCTLSGSFTGTAAPYSSGTYSFVTSYSGSSLSSITGVGEAYPNENYFNYSYLSPSTSMILTLMPTGGATDVETLVSGGQIDNSSFSFLDTGTYACSGTAVPSCSPAEVGYTAGAIGQSPVITTVTITLPATPPPTPTATPEPRFLASTGLAMLLVASTWLRRKQAA